MSTNPRTVVGPLINYNIPHQAGGYFMGYSITTNVLIYYDPHKNIVNIIQHAYVDEHDILIHTKEHCTQMSLMIGDTPMGSMHKPVLLHPTSN